MSDVFRNNHRVYSTTGESLEVELIAQVASTNKLAFEQLYRLYFVRLARFLDKMTRNSSLVEEVINDTMMVVWNKANTFNGTSKVSTWIFSIAYRQALKALNALHSSHTFEEPIRDSMQDPMHREMEVQLSEQRHEPDFQLHTKQIEIEFGRALLILPMDQRVTVSLTYYHGMGYQEIAETMGCPINTVKTRMFHARQRLKNMLSNSIGVSL
jgi:RNA polymerase sigma factor (sigma-70 family)